MVRLSPVAAIAGCLAVSPAASAGDLEWRAALGGQVDADPHGIADVGVRSGDLSAELLTDTIDLRFQPRGDHGRAWVAARLATFAAGLFISPWSDGAPDPSAALRSSYGGVEAGVLRYLPRGFYTGVQGSARYQVFAALSDTDVAVPPGRPVGDADLVLGWWTAEAQAWSRAGVDAWIEPGDGGRLAPHVHLQAAVNPAWPIGPLFELRAGAARHQDAVTRTRLGGLNPYVVPVAGAAWAEWWVEDYVATRIGLGGRIPVNGAELRLAGFSDAACADGIVSSRPAGPWAIGFGGQARLAKGRTHGELIVGHAPWIERQEGVGRTSLFLEIAVDWGRGTRLWQAAP
ncbi:MAG: hypothetical protein D6798_12335 [Deltaproteobacteria bacterium]|nr:MAG: hypothetical protein D6798_12335 [Deltaproteobacteria bacterium]